MSYDKLLSAERFSERKLDLPSSARSLYVQDYGRVLFSPAFRRLSGKTQVHPHNPSSAGHIHNRLSHSIEVSALSKSLGHMVGAYLRDYLSTPVDPGFFSEILQAASLAHDIGNPPLGHAGERLIQNFFSQRQDLLSGLSSEESRDFLYFDGNAQGMRMLLHCEFNRREGGMRLTYATLGALIKYPRTSGHPSVDKRPKFHFFSCHESDLLQIARKTGMIPKGDGSFARHPLAYLLEAADDTCYAVLDLEDWASLTFEKNSLDSALAQELLEVFSHMADMPAKTGLSSAPEFFDHLAHLRSRAIDRAAKDISLSYLQNHEAILSGTFEGTLIPPPIEEAKRFARRHIYSAAHDKHIQHDFKARFEALLSWLFDSAREAHQTRDYLKLNQDIELLCPHLSLGAKEGLSLRELYARMMDVFCYLTDQELTLHAARLSDPQLPPIPNPSR